MKIKVILVILALLVGIGTISAQDEPAPSLGEQTPRLRELDFSPFADELANFSSERSAAIDALVLDATVPDIQAAMDAGEVTSEELTLYFLSRIQTYDDMLRSYTEINANAIEEARAADALRAEGTVLGPLHGIPVNLKDNIGTTAPMHTTGGAEILLNWVPPEDAPLVQQLRAAGAVILGKANLSELAGAVNINPAGFTAVAGQTHNPHGPNFPTLGSSSGSGSSAAAYLTMVSVGSETNGSLIAPASLNGVVGMYPTDDLVPDEGVIPLVSFTDTAGPITRSVVDAAILLSVIDTADVDYTASLDANALSGVTVGFLAAELGPSPFLGLASFEPDLSDQAEKLQLIAETLSSAGANVVEASTVRTEALTPTKEILFRIYAPALGWTSMEDMDASISEEEQAQALALLTPAYVLTSTYFNPFVAGGVQYDTVAYINAAVGQISTAADFMAYNLEMPETRIPDGQSTLDQFVPLLEATGMTEADYQEMGTLTEQLASEVLDATFAAYDTDVLVSMVNEHSTLYALAGYPAITVPLGLRPNGQPTSVTFIGKPGQDAQLLAYAYAFEQASMLRVNPNMDWAAAQ